MSDTLQCSVCNAERERRLTAPLPCGHYTLEDTFGPMPVLNVPSMDDVFGAEAHLVREAREIVGRLEGVLRAHAEKSRTDQATLWQLQIEGVRAELNNPKWVPGQLTLKPLLRMLAPHKGTNAAINLLPYYPQQYTTCGDIRNALMHEDWAKLLQLGGAKRAYAWICSLEALVNMCVTGGGIASALLSLKGPDWPWPSLPSTVP